MQEPRGKKWSRDHDRELFTGLFLMIAQTSFLYHLGPYGTIFIGLGSLIYIVIQENTLRGMKNWLSY